MMTKPPVLYMYGWREPESPMDTVLTMVARDPEQNVEVTFAVDRRIGHGIIQELRYAALDETVGAIVVDPEPWQVLSIESVPWHAYRSGRERARIARND